MKRVLQRFLALMMVLWTSSQLSAADFEADGTYYDFLSESQKTVEVVRAPSITRVRELSIPAKVTHDGEVYTVTAIGARAFSSYSELRRVELPSTLVSIGERAFDGCVSLECITIPDGVTNIGNRVFGSCYELKKLVFLGQKPPTVSLSFTRDIDQRTVIYVPNGTLDSYNQRFRPSDYNVAIVEGDGTKDYLTNFEKDGIRYLVRPLEGSTVEVMSNQSHMQGEGIVYSGKLEIPAEVNYGEVNYTVNGIARGAFERSPELNEIILPATIQTIYDNVTAGSDNITKIVMKGTTPPESFSPISGFDRPWTIIYVPEGALDAYKEKKDWSVCNLVEGNGQKDYFIYFEQNDFTYAVIDFENEGTDVKVCGLADDSEPTKIEIPATVTYKDKKYSVTEIRKNAFQSKYTLKSVVIPSSIKQIGQQAFDDDRNLEEVTVLAEEPPVCSYSIFDDRIYGTCKLFIPENAKEKYADKEPWSKFGTANVETIRLTISPSRVELGVGGTTTLNAIVFPEGINVKGASWASSDEKIAKVDPNGKVVAEGVGTAKITATYESLTAECTVTVIEKVVTTENIEIIASDEPVSAKTLKKGETLQLTAKTTPEDATDKISWSSDNVEVATVDETGLVTAKGVGKAEIKVTAGENSATCEITVISPAESISLNVEATKTINKGDKLNIIATIVPEDCTDGVEWSVDGDAVTVAVSEDKKNCEVTAVKAGDATVTVKAGEKSASCKITVKVPMTGIELNKTEAKGYIGGTVQLTATVKPEDTTDYTTVTWKSSDEEVATVDENGLVSCLAEGEAVITATCGEFSDECTVTVTDRPPFVAITSLELSESEIELALNFTYSLFAIIAPENATNTELEWNSSDINVARVYEGVVYGIVPGEAVITAKTTDGSNLSASCKVTIVETSGIDGIEGDGVKVTAAAGVITVKGATMGATVEVYSMSGACVAAKTVESSVEELPVAASGIYVVRVGGKTFKVAL